MSRTNLMAISSSVSKESNESGSYPALLWVGAEQTRKRNSHRGYSARILELSFKLILAHEAGSANAKHVPRAKEDVENDRATDVAVLKRNCELLKRLAAIDMIDSGMDGERSGCRNMGTTYMRQRSPSFGTDHV